MYEMYELYGDEYEWPQTPSTMVAPGGGPLLLSSAKSFETFQSASAELPGSYPAASPKQTGFNFFSVPPPGVHYHQPAELEESFGLVKPQGSLEAAHRHRRMASGRWGRGTSWAPAELPTHEQGGFV